MPSEVRLKKKTEQLKEGLKSSILGPQNLGSGGARAPRAPPGSASDKTCSLLSIFTKGFQIDRGQRQPYVNKFSSRSITELLDLLNFTAVCKLYYFSN